MSAPLAKPSNLVDAPNGRPRKRPANKRQGGPELWARIDALRGDEQMDYPPQPVHKELDYE